MEHRSLSIIDAPRKAATFKVAPDGLQSTLQGEGLTAGEKIVLLRLKFCNLMCTFCDTPDTSYPAHPDYKNFVEWTVHETAQKIVHAARGTCTRLMITGGEPLLRQELIAELLESPLLHAWDTEIETNGTIVPSALKGKTVQYNVSPKLSNSDMPFERRIRPAVLQALQSEYNILFKFVVRDIADIEEMERDVFPHIQEYRKRKKPLYVMPEGTTPARLTAVMRDIHTTCAERGYILLDRLHIRHDIP